MEDFFETTISEVDGQMVAFFGVFDGKPVLYSLKLVFLSLPPSLFFSDLVCNIVNLRSNCKILIAWYGI